MVIYQPSPQTHMLTTHSLSIYTALEKVSATAEDKYVHSTRGAGSQARVLLQCFQPVLGLNFLNKQLEIHELRVVLFGTPYRPSKFISSGSASPSAIFSYLIPFRPYLHSRESDPRYPCMPNGAASLCCLSKIFAGFRVF